MSFDLYFSSSFLSLYESLDHVLHNLSYGDLKGHMEFGHSVDICIDSSVPTNNTIIVTRRINYKKNKQKQTELFGKMKPQFFFER